MFSRRQLLNIVIPLIINQTLAVLIGIEDSLMVSFAGEAAISGVGLVDSINQLLVNLFTSLAAGGSVVISQMLGTRQIERANNASKQLIWTVFLAGLVMTGVSLTFRLPLLRLIFGNIDADVMANASAYFFFTSMAFPFLAIYSGCQSVFHSMGNARVSMVVALVMNVVNIAANALLVLVLKMGVIGAALATLTARFVGAMLLLCLLHNKKNMLYVEHILRFKPNFSTIGNICRIGIPNGLENSMFQLGRLMTQSLISTFGTAQIAANAAVLSVTSLQYIPGSAMGVAIITMVGRCIGAQEQQQAKKYSVRLVAIAYGVIIALSAVICLFLRPIVSSYHLSAESAQLARNLILYHSLCVCTIWPIAFTLPNAFRAASDVKFTMVLSIFSMWAFRIGLSYLLNALFDLGIMSVWYAMAVDWIFRAVVFTVHFLRGSWLKKYRAV